MHDKLQQVFRKVFADDKLIITEASSAKDIKMWDSLSHLELIAAVEKEFKIRFSFTEVMEFETVGDMIRAIEEK